MGTHCGCWWLPTHKWVHHEGGLELLQGKEDSQEEDKLTGGWRHGPLVTGRLVLPQIHGAAPGEAHGPGSGPGCTRAGGEAAAGSGIQTQPAPRSTDGTTTSCCGGLEAEEGEKGGSVTPGGGRLLLRFSRNCGSLQVIENTWLHYCTTLSSSLFVVTSWS